MATMTAKEKGEFVTEVTRLGYRKAGPWTYKHKATGRIVRAVIADRREMRMDIPRTLTLLVERAGVDAPKPEGKNKRRRKQQS